MPFNRSDSKALLALIERGDLSSLDKMLRSGITRDAITVTAATLALTMTEHGDALILLKRAAGQAVTLPAASGSGAKFRLLVATTISSNTSTVKVANASDTIIGWVTTATTTTGAGTHEAAGGTDDTVTLNGTTTGGIAGSYIELEDVDTNVWLLTARLVGSGSLATPLSATVS